MEFTLLGATMTGVVATWVTVKLLERFGRLDGIDSPMDVLVGAAAVGVFSGRIVEMLTAGVNPILNPFDVLLIRGGVSTAAASFAAFAVLAWTYRADLTILDLIAPAAVAGLAGWHAGCLWTGACLGTATGSELGFYLPGSVIARHPTEIYAAILLLLAAPLVARVTGRYRATGVAIAGASLARLITEPFRPSLSGGPIWWYTLTAIIGIALLIHPPTEFLSTQAKRGGQGPVADG